MSEKSPGFLPGLIVFFALVIFFGTIIAMVSCHYGLKVASIRGVPQAAIRSVVGSMSGVIVISVIITAGMVMGGFYAR